MRRRSSSKAARFSFFFQAEDGIRDKLVTGVQTCALPIWDLKAWQHARTLVALTKSAIARLPETERYALADQWRRATYSVALNIAEGASRRGVKDFRRPSTSLGHRYTKSRRSWTWFRHRATSVRRTSPLCRPSETSARERYTVCFEHCRTDRSNPVVESYGLWLAALRGRWLLLSETMQCPKPPD